MLESGTLTYQEAEKVAADLARGWTGLTGATATPKVETLADLVQRVIRKASEVVAAREVDWYEMSEAPTDGKTIMVDVDGVEMLAVWWINWEAWRQLAPDFRRVGEKIDPTKWRPLTSEEARGDV